MVAHSFNPSTPEADLCEFEASSKRAKAVIKETLSQQQTKQNQTQDLGEAKSLVFRTPEAITASRTK